MRETTASLIARERQKLAAYLTHARLRVSSGREIVFNKVMRTHGHFTAEELVKTLLKERIKVSRATVYRSLREFLEAGIVRETAYGEKHHHFEHVYDEKLHHHARCLRCYGVIEVPCLKEEEPYVALLKKEGFHVLGHEMHFYGICKNCRRYSDDPLQRKSYA